MRERSRRRAAEGVFGVLALDARSVTAMVADPASSQQSGRVETVSNPASVLIEKFIGSYFSDSENDPWAMLRLRLN
jgi:hypothetical protein